MWAPGWGSAGHRESGAFLPLRLPSPHFSKQYKIFSLPRPGAQKGAPSQQAAPGPAPPLPALWARGGGCAVSPSPAGRPPFPACSADPLLGSGLMASALLAGRSPQWGRLLYEAVVMNWGHACTPVQETTSSAPASVSDTPNLIRKAATLCAVPLLILSLTASPDSEKCSLISKIKELNLAPYYSHK